MTELTIRKLTGILEVDDEYMGAHTLHTNLCINDVHVQRRETRKACNTNNRHYTCLHNDINIMYLHIRLCRVNFAKHIMSVSFLQFFTKRQGKTKCISFSSQIVNNQFCSWVCSRRKKMRERANYKYTRPNRSTKCKINEYKYKL